MNTSASCTEENDRVRREGRLEVGCVSSVDMARASSSSSMSSGGSIPDLEGRGGNTTPGDDRPNPRSMIKRQVQAQHRHENYDAEELQSLCAYLLIVCCTISKVRCVP